MKGRSPLLFSYCIPIDDGAAPNPYGGVCTLTICKPVVRRIAEVGDWVVGTGSKKSPIGDCSGKIVYAMRVTQKMPMSEYDRYTKDNLPIKIPKWKSQIYLERLGDSIYNFSFDPPKQRDSVHRENNRKTDLGGICALLSSEFFYFGDKPVALPKDLLPIVKQGQGHKSKSNADHVAAFVDWIQRLGLKKNVLHGTPQVVLLPDEEPECAVLRCNAAIEDEKLGDCE